MKIIQLWIVVCAVLTANTAHLLKVDERNQQRVVTVAITPPEVVESVVVGNGKMTRSEDFDYAIETTVYMLVDTNPSMKYALANGIRRVLTRMQKYRQPKEKWVLAYFDNVQHIVYDDEKKNIETIENLAKLIYPGKKRTDLFGSMQSAIDNLGKRHTDKKILVVFSDAKSIQQRTGGWNRIIKAARDSGIQVVSVAYRDTLESQILRKISEETAGAFWKANRQSSMLPETFYSEFVHFLRATGNVVIPAVFTQPTPSGSRDVTLEFRHPQGSSILKIALETAVVPTVPRAAPAEKNSSKPAKKPVVSPVVKPASTVVKADTKRSFFQKYKLYIAIAAAMIVLLILLFVLLRKKPEPAVAEDEAFSGSAEVTQAAPVPPSPQTAIHQQPAPHAFANAQQPLAYLEAQEGPRYSIAAFPANIGKSPDNDIVMNNQYISRRHATIVQKNGGYEIIDQNSSNGIKVDGVKVVGKAMLRNGSLIEFGPYGVVFEVPGAPAQMTDDERTRFA